MSQASTDLDNQLFRLAEPVCRALGLELVQVRYLREPGGAVVKVVIDQGPRGPQGPSGQGDHYQGSAVSLADCTAVSRDLSAVLEVHDDLLAGRYRLEVGSPGLDRPLVRLADFERFRGETVKLRTRAAIAKRRKFTGRLLGVVDEQVQLEQDGETVTIPYAQIARANLVYQF